jgi:hypothetical protein
MLVPTSFFWATLGTRQTHEECLMRDSRAPDRESRQRDASCPRGSERWTEAEESREGGWGQREPVEVEPGHCFLAWGDTDETWSRASSGWPAWRHRVARGGIRQGRPGAMRSGKDEPRATLPSTGGGQPEAAEPARGDEILLRIGP